MSQKAMETELNLCVLDKVNHVTKIFPFDLNFDRILI